MRALGARGEGSSPSFPTKFGAARHRLMERDVGLAVLTEDTSLSPKDLPIYTQASERGRVLRQRRAREKAVRR